MKSYFIFIIKNDLVGIQRCDIPLKDINSYIRLDVTKEETNSDFTKINAPLL